ncbi:hypothetical protein C3L33_22157, partial [Rhododendron williamsianum]
MVAHTGSPLCCYLSPFYHVKTSPTTADREAGVGERGGDIQREHVLHVPRHQAALLRDGGNPTVYELDEDPRGGKEIEKALMMLLGSPSGVPVVFIGGKLVGAMDRVMASHINGSLVPLLKEAGALWL